jgi:hypothetical protein
MKGASSHAPFILLFSDNVSQRNMPPYADEYQTENQLRHAIGTHDIFNPN